MISPIRKFAGFACECRTFENYINTQKALHVNVGLYFVDNKEKAGKMKICKEDGQFMKYYLYLCTHKSRIDCRINKTGEQFYYE